MSIAEAVKQATAPRYCKFGQVLVDLPGPDFQAITDGLDGGGLTVAKAVRILNAHGYDLSTTVAKDHRRGDCCCKDAA